MDLQETGGGNGWAGEGKQQFNQLTNFSNFPFHFKSNNLTYLVSYPKSQKPMKAVIRHLPFTTLPEDISDVLLDPGFDVFSVKQMSATH
jgi:hypothetical protein